MSDVTQCALPGFSSFINQAVVDRSGATDLTDEKRYTAEVVMRDYPQTYASVVRALFYYRLPTRTVRDLFRMSGATVAAIRNHVLAASANDGAVSFFTKARAQSQRDIVLCQILDVIEDRLSDKTKLDALSITELMEMLLKLEHAKPASNGTENPNSVNSNPDITIVEPDQFDSVLNGLVGKEKSAALKGATSGVRMLEHQSERLQDTVGVLK